MNRTARSIVIYVLILAFIATGFITGLNRGRRAILKETIASISYATLDDGAYGGEYSQYRWSATLEVTIEDGRIIHIEVIEDHALSDDLARAKLFQRLYDSTSLDDVDVVSGATVTSLAYLKAVEDALDE